MADIKTGLPEHVRYINDEIAKDPSINAVIFDMDGVLVDSEMAIATASAHSLKEWDVIAEPEEFFPYRGTGDDNFIGSVARIHGKEYDVKMKARAYEIYLEHSEKWVKVFPWSRPVIEKFAEMGLQLAVASASDHIKVMENLRVVGADPALFAAVITGSDVTKQKPAPDIFLKAAERAGMDPSRTLVCEDSLAGIRAARSAGMRCAAVTTSFPPEQLIEAGAQIVTDDFRALFEIAQLTARLEAYEK